MDDIFRLMLFLHLGALGIAIGTNIIMPMLMPRIAGLDGPARQTMLPLARRLSLNGRLSLAVLVLTGVAMVALRHGDYLWANPWFVAKMALVAVIVLNLALSFLPIGKRIPARVTGVVTRLALIGIVFCAVMTFS